MPAQSNAETTPNSASHRAASAHTRARQRGFARRVVPAFTPEAAGRSNRRVDAAEPLNKNEWMKPHCWAAALLLTLALPAHAAPELYRWIDVDGAVRYTPNPNRVPNAQRNTLVRVEPGMASPPPITPAGAATPAAIHAPPGEIDADPFAAPEPPRRALAPVPRDEVSGVDAGPPGPVAREAPASAAAAPVEPAGETPAAAEPAVESHAAVVSPSAKGAETARVAAPPRIAAAPSPPSQELRSRREELVARIAEDEETLKALISEARAEGGDPLIDSNELREIARRLPGLQEELRALDEQSARLVPN